MTTITDLRSFACNSYTLFPAINCNRIPSTSLSSTHINRPNLSIYCPFPFTRNRDPTNRSRWRFRCSIAEESTITPSKVCADGNGDGQSVLDCVIVGAGISGLCIAQALATKHADVAPNVLVTEARDRVGGNITTVEGDGYLWEEGPNSFQPSDPMLTMVVDSGLKDDLVLGDPNAPRFVLWDGKLRPVPSSPTDLPFFDLMSFAGKLRAGFGALGFRPPPPVCPPDLFLH
uniref:Protoporphyrinogen oxidase n=1 Tax=Davidia involucrata TaxID=16924 RepID=A0A5B7BA88_DAVIN